MVLNGYTPETLAPILIGLAIVIAILYLLRVRRRSVNVPFIGLWREVIEKSNYKRWHDWLKRLISFLLWMAVVGLIALALMDPREEEDDSARRHAVIIIDSSASMNTVDEDSDCGSRFQCAIKDARDLVDHMKMTDRAVIVQASGIVSAVSGPFTSDKSALDLTLRDLKPGATSTDLVKAIELADNLTRQKENAEVFLFTDGLFDQAEDISRLIPANAAFEQKTYGKPIGNLSIEAFNVRRYIANRLAFEVFFKVHNGFDKPVTAKLRILNLNENESRIDEDSDHTVLSEKTLTIASGSSELRLYENLTLGSSRMAATIELIEPSALRDPLELDNIAYARIPDYAKPDILCVTPGNLFLEAALLLNENYRVSFVKPGDGSILNSSGSIDLSRLTGEHDIVILDNSYHNLLSVDTENPWHGKVIYINPESSYAPFKSKKVDNPVIERVNSKHDVARWLSLKNLNIGSASVYTNVSNSDMVMRAIEGPLMATRSTEQQKLVSIGFSLVESDLIFRVGLPILFINSIDWLMNENNEPVRGYPTGTSYHIRVPESFVKADIERPDGSRITQLPVYDNSVTVYGEYAGFYRIYSTDHPEVHPLEIAANFIHDNESNLMREPAELKGRVHLTTTLGTDEEETEVDESLLMTILSKLPKSSQYLWVLALLIAMGLISIEWLTYHRRWTV